MRSRRLTLPNQAPRSRGGPMDRPPGGDYNHHLNINSQVEGKTANDPPRDRGKPAACYMPCNADPPNYLPALPRATSSRTAFRRKQEVGGGSRLGGKTIRSSFGTWSHGKNGRLSGITERSDP